MEENISELIGLQVYTRNGVFVGSVDNLVIDVDKNTIYGLFIRETNPLIVEGATSISIPYRWVSNVGDIILLRFFPSKVSTSGEGPPLDEDLVE